jgi:hypothetical protein
VATLTTQNITRAGIAESLVAAAGGGDACETGTDMLLKVVNGGGASITVTLAIPSGRSSIPNVTYGNVQVTVPNASHRWIKVGSEMTDPTTGLCTITYSAVTSVTVGAFKNTQP